MLYERYCRFTDKSNRSDRCHGASFIFLFPVKTVFIVKTMKTH